MDKHICQKTTKLGFPGFGIETVIGGHKFWAKDYSSCLVIVTVM